MISLPKLLLEAAGCTASEIVLEVGKRPTVATPEGSKEFGEALGEAVLFEALTGVLGPEQQAELAVGNVVEFRVSGQSGEWTILVEDCDTGLTLRGRRDGTDDSELDPEVGTPVDLPPLAPFEPEHHGEAPAPEPVLKRATQVDLGLNSYAEDDPPWADEPQPAPPVPGDADEYARRSPVPRPPPIAEAGSKGGASGVDFAIVPGEDPGRMATQADTGTSGRPHVEPVVPPIAVTPAEGAPASRGAPPASAGAASSVRVVTGTLCFVDDGFDAQSLAAAQGAPVTVLDEATAVDLAGRALTELDRGASYVVCLEDPSRVAVWLLRRLEEGSRVFVQTRASSVAGARRVFLGLHGGAAAQWLDAHPVQWLAGDPTTQPVDGGSSGRARGTSSSGAPLDRLQP